MFLTVGSSGGTPELTTYFGALVCTVASLKDAEPAAFTFLDFLEYTESVLSWGPGRGLAR